MRHGLFVWALLATASLAWPALGDAPMQPPMNTFNYAFYTCEAGAFEVDYDSDTPTHATIVTSNHNQRHELSRTTAQSGVQFSGDGVKFWTDGKKVLLQGTSVPLQNCRLKTK